jgi:protein-S-isoprenylcysteine O-methyltransferase Ste14
MHALELKVPPVAVGLAAALAMWLASRAVPSVVLPPIAREIIAPALVAVGAFISLAGVASFLRAKTTVNPTKPGSASTLVTTGVYRFTRNPMYLGLLLVLLGWATFLSNGLAFIVVPLFVLYMNRFQIVPEERALSALFGAEFDAYAARVRRWL